ncbi:response regulator [Nibrella saemangeumensis]|uniref:Response regulator n=1 Tax=Nibrella saemangeumensis TaxID=1084526 RepID=A0ABP8NDZ1_9BACT
MSSIRDPIIYLVDDQDDDRQLLHYEMEKQCSNCHVIGFVSGSSLFDNLQDVTRPRLPNLILLNLHVCKAEGLAVLAFIKTNPNFRRIPVIMMAHSASPEEVMQCYDKGSNAFMGKPRSAAETETMVARIKQYWLDVAELPMDLK